MKPSKNLLNNFKTITYFFQLSLKHDPSYLISMILRTIVETGKPFPSIFFPAWIIDSLLIHNGKRAVTLAFLYAGITFLFDVLLRGLSSVCTLRQSKWKDYLYRLLAEKAMHLTLETLEQVKISSLFTGARNAISGDVSYSVRSLSGGRGADAIGTETLQLFSGVIKICFMTAILSQIHPLISAAIILVMIFHMYGGNKERRAAFEERQKTMRYRNKNQYVGNTMISFQYAKEIRLFHLQDYLQDKFRENKYFFYKAREETKGEYWSAQFLSIFGEGFQNAVIYGYMAWQVLVGKINAAGFTQYTAAALSLSSSLSSLIQSFLNLQLYAGYFADFHTAMFLPEEDSVTGTDLEQISEEWKKHMEESGKESGIVFEHVSFTYSGVEHEALSDINLTIPLLQSVSLVGPNGSGKSTLVKLLMRYYRPDQGRILLNGIDIWSIPVEVYRKNISAVFQDFSLFAFRLLDNIRPGGEADKKFFDVLADAGLDKKMKELPAGENTPLMRAYHSDGIDLSGGERQKCAIARMLIRASSIMVLDEPTAALDARAESEIYDQFHRMTEGKTVIYISHRMSSCRFCNRIIVLDKGCVVQTGTHKELEAQDGLYHDMYRTQADFYNASEGEGECMQS